MKPPSLRLSPWPAAAALVLLALALGLPHVLDGVEPLREERQFIDRAQALGAWHAADPDTAAMRPVVRVLYALQYGLGHEHLPVLHVIAVASVAALAVVLQRFLTRFTTESTAFIVAALWLAAPNHLTLDHWPAVINVTLAMILAITGLALFQGRVARGRTPVAAVAVCIAAILLYEAIAPVALIGVVVLALRFGGEGWRAVAIRSLIPIAAVTAFTLVLASRNRDVEWSDPFRFLLENFGLVREVPLLALVAAALIVAVFIQAAAGPRLAGRSHTEPEIMVLVGVIVALVGYLPFATSGFDAMFVGVGDRGNVIGSIGGAVAIVGALRMLLRRDIAATAATLVVVVALVPLHLHRSAEWGRALRDVSDTCARLAEDHKRHASTITLEVRPAEPPVYIDEASELRLCLLHQHGLGAGDVRVLRAQGRRSGRSSRAGSDSSRVT